MKRIGLLIILGVVKVLTFETLASGSSGNAYVVSDGQTKLLLEAGIPFKKVQQLMDFETSQLQGILISHEHSDHMKGVKTFLERGINVYMSQGTKEAYGMQHRRLKTFELKKQFRIGSFLILPFDVEHDAAEPAGFLIRSDNGQKLLFMTDTYYCKYKFDGVNVFAVECNYDLATLNESVANGLHPAQKKRVMRSHMGLNTLKTFFNETDLSKCEKIYLLHLSNSNANRHTIFTEVAKVTGKEIEIVG